MGVEMKNNKIFKFAIFILIFAFCVFIYKYLTIEEKEVLTVKKTTTYDTVVCSGTVESKDIDYIILNQSVTVNKVYIEQGERINKNDKIFSANINGYDEDITSDTNGIIDKLNISEGKTYQSNKVLVSILNTDKIYINAAVSENDINKIKTGQKATAECSACDDLYYCIVDKIYSGINKNSSQLQSNYLNVLLSVNNADNQILPGFSSTITININKYNNVFIVPESAIFKENNQNYVYTYSKGKAIKTPVTKSVTTDKGTIITHGLEQNDKELYNCSDLNDGDLIKVKYVEF